MKKIRQLIAFMIITTLVAGCMVVNAAPGSGKVISLNAIEPESLDPQVATSQAAIDIAGNIIEGLMRRSGKNIIPGIASRYEVSSDGLTYTFYLRNASWSDGKPVTANDFAYAWQRALDPKTDSDYAFLLYYIKNGQKYNSGQVTADKLGIRVINAKTLQVTLENRTSYFADLTTSMAYMPVRKDMIDKHGSGYFNNPSLLLSNGPFKLTEWNHYDDIVITRNASYWNNQNTKLDQINYYMFSSMQDMADAYYGGAVDVINVPQSIINQIPQNDIVHYSTGSVWYVQFNNRDKAGILINANIRKALTLSIDRKAILSETGRVLDVPALSLVAPDVIPGKSKTFREEAGNLLKDNDVATAKAAYSLGFKQLNLKKVPTLKLLVDDNSTTIQQGNALARQWKEKLGIDVVVEMASFGDRLNKMHEGDYQMTISGWGPDYYDALTYLEMFDSSAQPNQFGYSSKTFNDLIKSIKREPNKSLRIDLMKRAEKQLMNDSVVAPVFFKYGAAAKKPYVHNVSITSAGTLFDFASASIFKEGRAVMSPYFIPDTKANPYNYLSSLLRKISE